MHNHSKGFSGGITQALDELDRLASVWLALPADPEAVAAAWEGETGERSRRFQAMALWREYSLGERRQELERAIARVLADGQDWAARLVLLLFRRDAGLSPDAAVPAWFRAARELLAGQDRLLEVLPALPDAELSVVLPTYNRLPLLRQAIEALQAQSFRNWRLYVGDDASDDGSWDYLQALAARDSRVTISRNAVNRGCGPSTQALIAACRSELVFCLSDDHLLEPGALQALMNCFWRKPWIAAAAGSWRSRRADGSQTANFGPYYPQACIADNRRELQRHGLFCPLGPTAIFRRRVLAELARFDHWLCPEGVGYCLWDYLATARLLGRYEMAYAPELILTMLLSPDSMSASRFNTRDLLDLLRGLIEDYAALYGPGRYPLAVISQYCHWRRLELINHFQRNLTLAEDLSDFEARLQAHRPAYTAWYKLQAQLASLSSASEPLLVDLQNPAFGSLAPAYAHYRTRPDGYRAG